MSVQWHGSGQARGSASAAPYALLFVVALGCRTAGPQAEVVARVGGEPITRGEVDRALEADGDLSAEIAGAPDAIVRDARRAVLDRLILDRLLAETARRRGVTPEAIVEEATRATQVSDRDAETSYQLARRYPGGNVMLERRTRRLLAGSEEAGRARVRDWVRREHVRLELWKIVEPVRKETTIEIVSPAQTGRTGDGSTS